MEQPHPSVDRRQRRSHMRKHTRSSSDATSVDTPWQQTAEAYEWVVQEECFKRRRSPIKTEEWVREQQRLFRHQEYRTEDYNYFNSSRPFGSSYGKENWEDLAYDFGVEAEDWMRQQERARRLAQEREKARARIQEEVRRIEARFQQKREAERRAREDERRRAYAEIQEKEKKDRAKLDKLIMGAWTSYERRWATLAATSEALEFKTIPWPVIIPPRDTGDITRDAIVAFLFSSVHSTTQTRKDRIRSAQLRWHPDRFGRFLGRIVDKERAKVEEGVGIVARCLNELMEKEKERK